MTRPLTTQTRAILRRLKAGKPAVQIAKELKIPTYTVYNAKHRHIASLNQKAEEELTRKQSVMSTDVGTFASHNAAYAHEVELAAHEKERAFQQQNAMNRNAVSAWGVATAHEAELQRLGAERRYTEGLGSMWGQIPLVAGTVAKEQLNFTPLREPIVVTPMRKRLSLWRRIKAVFTGEYA